MVLGLGQESSLECYNTAFMIMVFSKFRCVAQRKITEGRFGIYLALLSTLLIFNTSWMFLRRWHWKCRTASRLKVSPVSQQRHTKDQSFWINVISPAGSI